jgi:hypothetical protein
MCFAQPESRLPAICLVKQVDGNQFFTEEKRQEYRRRVESVTPNSQRQWVTDDGS